ncbi:MAG TPA: hypothetical protein VKG38_08840 [Solirubrobacteraceae bacterium]|nr:hypothetical protein [Solirubrobacteraceae bacterium]
MALFKKGKRFGQWSPAEVADGVEFAVVGDPEELYLRSAVVLRSAPERLPPKDAAAWAEALDTETDGRGIPPYFVFKFHCEDGERGRIVSQREHYSLLIRVITWAFDRDSAMRIACDWTKEKTMVAVSFAYIPGVYQAALIEAVTGTPRTWQGYLMSHWCWVDGVDYEHALVRRYPPAGTNVPPPTQQEESEGRMPDDAVALVPREVVEMAHRQLLASPREPT